MKPWLIIAFVAVCVFVLYASMNTPCGLKDQEIAQMMEEFAEAHKDCTECAKEYKEAAFLLLQRNEIAQDYAKKNNCRVRYIDIPQTTLSYWKASIMGGKGIIVYDE